VNEAYTAYIPDFERCSAFGNTPEEALAQLLIAKAAILETMRQKNLPIPQAPLPPGHLSNRLSLPPLFWPEKANPGQMRPGLLSNICLSEKRFNDLSDASSDTA
jgi:predicted RNase H-like HicB family nuclease